MFLKNSKLNLNQFKSNSIVLGELIFVDTLIHYLLNLEFNLLLFITLKFNFFT